MYTHGFGTVAAQVNSITADGGPLLTLEDIPPVGEPTTEQPRIYYGEFNDVDFVVVNSSTDELDFEGASGETPFTYTGDGAASSSAGTSAVPSSRGASRTRTC